MFVSLLVTMLFLSSCSNYLFDLNQIGYEEVQDTHITILNDGTRKMTGLCTIDGQKMLFEAYHNGNLLTKVKATPWTDQ